MERATSPAVVEESMTMTFANHHGSNNLELLYPQFIPFSSKKKHVEEHLYSTEKAGWMYDFHVKPDHLSAASSIFPVWSVSLIDQLSVLIA